MSWVIVSPAVSASLMDFARAYPAQLSGGMRQGARELFFLRGHGARSISTFAVTTREGRHHLGEQHSRLEALLRVGGKGVEEGCVFAARPEHGRNRLSIPRG